jgi:hypothetical protein
MGTITYACCFPGFLIVAGDPDLAGFDFHFDRSNNCRKDTTKILTTIGDLNLWQKYLLLDRVLALVA